MIERVGIVAKRGLEHIGEHLASIGRWLEERRVQPVFERETAEMARLPPDWVRVERDDLPKASELILVLGGNGTLIAMADRIAQAGRDVPILGVNFGSLGFLTEITLPELYPSLSAALDGVAGYDERMMLHSAVRRNGTVVEDRLVLNDVVVTRSALSRLIALSVWVGGDFVARFHADGVVLASPTGSSAYNLSAGGPIVHPAVDALVLTPIAPHILTNRPIVIPASKEVRIEPAVSDSGYEVFVVFDGQAGFELQPNDVVTVRAAEPRLRVVRASARSYFEVLRQKLKWAER